MYVLLVLITWPVCIGGLDYVPSISDMTVMALVNKK